MPAALVKAGGKTAESRVPTKCESTTCLPLLRSLLPPVLSCELHELSCLQSDGEHGNLASKPAQHSEQEALQRQGTTRRTTNIKNCT